MIIISNAIRMQLIAILSLFASIAHAQYGISVNERLDRIQNSLDELEFQQDLNEVLRMNEITRKNIARLETNNIKKGERITLLKSEDKILENENGNLTYISSSSIKLIDNKIIIYKLTTESQKPKFHNEKPFFLKIDFGLVNCFSRYGLISTRILLDSGMNIVSEQNNFEKVGKINLNDRIEYKKFDHLCSNINKTKITLVHKDYIKSIDEKSITKDENDIVSYISEFDLNAPQKRDGKFYEKIWVISFVSCSKKIMIDAELILLDNKLNTIHKENINSEPKEYRKLSPLNKKEFDHVCEKII